MTSSTKALCSLLLQGSILITPFNTLSLKVKISGRLMKEMSSCEEATPVDPSQIVPHKYLNSQSFYC